MNSRSALKINYLFIILLLILSSCSKTPEQQDITPPDDRFEAPDGTTHPLWLKSSGDGIYKIGKPYVVNGTWYFPKEDYKYDEVGNASWYGEDFHKKPTANGEIFDMNMISAAHKTLPLPSIVRVTNLENGRSLIVRVNDRGPFVNDRLIDLSKKASELLGFKDKGLTKVRIQLLPEETNAAVSLAQNNTLPAQTAFAESTNQSQETATTSLADFKPSNHEAGWDKETPYVLSGKPKQDTTESKNRGALLPAPEVVASASQETSTKMPATTPSPPSPSKAPDMTSEKKSDPMPIKTSLEKGHYVQTGAFSRADNARAHAHKLKAIEGANIYKDPTAKRPLHKVRFGPSQSREQAEGVRQKIFDNGHAEAVVIHHNG